MYLSCISDIWRDMKNDYKGISQEENIWRIFGGISE
jgi:hypothetical protein